MSDIHDTSNDMPKIANTVQIGGIYKFNARYPKHLIGEVNGFRKVYRKTLGTGDWKEAKRKVAQIAYEFELEKERLEKLIQSKTKDTSNPQKAFGKLTDSEKNRLILDWFLTNERKAERSRSEIQLADDELWKKERTADALADFGSYKSVEDMPLESWLKITTKFLSDREIAHSAEDALDLAHLIRAARIEIQRRSIERLTGENPGPVDERFSMASIIASQGQATPHSHRIIAEICERFPTRFAKGKLKKSTLAGYQMPIEILIDFFGPDKPLKSIGYDEAEKLVSFLAEIPANKTQRFPGMDFRAAAKLANVAKTGKGLAPKRQLDLFITIQSILSYAEEIQWIDRNPFDSKALRGLLPAVKRKEHVSFTATELRALFTSSSLLSVRGTSNEEGLATEGKFWVPLLCVFHGLRINEAASLLIEDVKVSEGVHYLSVREEDDTGQTIKSLKSEVSQRRVPIHRQIIESGFLNFVERRREQGEDPFLFCEFKENSLTGNRAKDLSQWINRQIRKVTTNQPNKKRKTFHTFRHQVTDELRRITDSDDKRTALLGWTTGGGKKNAGADYGKGFPLSQLKAIVDQVTIEGLEDNPWQ